MAISNGRTYLESIIEDAIQTFESMISDIPSYLKDGEALLEAEIENRVKLAADGDKEIEFSVRNSMNHCLLEYDNLFSCFYESYVISTYSFYEKTLKLIFDEYKLKLKSKDNRSYVVKYLEAIRHYLGIPQFDNETELMILTLNDEFRDLRNNLVHEGEMRSILTFLQCVKSEYLTTIEKFDDGKYILFTLSQIKSVLLEIVRKIELHKRQEN